MSGRSVAADERERATAALRARTDRSGPGGGTALAGLVGLQQTAGNAAVVQLLRDGGDVHVQRGIASGLKKVWGKIIPKATKPAALAGMGSKELALATKQFGALPKFSAGEPVRTVWDPVKECGWSPAEAKAFATNSGLMEWSQRMVLVEKWAQGIGHRGVLDFLRAERLARAGGGESKLLLGWVNSTRPAVMQLFNRSLQKFHSHYVDPDAAVADTEKGPEETSPPPAKDEPQEVNDPKKSHYLNDPKEPHYLNDRKQQEET